MWGASEEPPGATGDGPPDPIVNVKEACEQNKNQLENLKEIMLKNKQSLKRKEEKVQEYAQRLSKIKSRAKLSRHSRDAALTSEESFSYSKGDEIVGENVDTVDDISQAKTSKAKSSLLQRKLAENRKAFEQRSKEITESKRVVVEKVEAIKQQLDEKLNATLITSATSEVHPLISSAVDIHEREQKIADLSNKVLELEAIIVDLQENLKEKDAVIDSKTKAVALVSADFSKKGKSTLDTLEDTKDEMRTMQENFVLIETSLKNKNENLLEQLNERDNKITQLESLIQKNELAESASADFSRSTMDTLAETKDAMRSMQENFVLIESSMKSKIDSLLQQLEEREIKLSQARETILRFESGAGIVRPPEIEDLQFKLEKLEQSQKQLQEEKYTLQKTIVELQDQVLDNKSAYGSGAIMEKDNRIAELENLIQELKQSNELLQEESKIELQNQISELSSQNEEYANKINDLEKLVHDLEVEKNDIAAKLPDENIVSKENEKIQQLTKELEDLNKTMIKMKAQHRSKLKNLQKQLENFKKVSDVNAELVKLGNQVTLLEEEKASSGDWQERIIDLESKVATQEKELQMHIAAIGALENQKLDLIQELHSVKKEVSELEAENAESENQRVTAEMKVVDLEEQLEVLHKAEAESKTDFTVETMKKLEILTQENNELMNKLSKLEEKSTSDTGSTESFENIQEADKTELLKRIEDLTTKNNELVHKLSKVDERASSNAGSTESFETINNTDKNELQKKMEQLTQEYSELVMKLSKTEEKGSSDTGSTGSFERIPEHNESLAKIELLTQENNDLVIKLYKLEEKLERIEGQQEPDRSEETEDQGTSVLLEEVDKYKTQLNDLMEENNLLKQNIEAAVIENNDTTIQFTKLEEKYSVTLEKLKHLEDRFKEVEERGDLEVELSAALQKMRDLDAAKQDLELTVETLHKERDEILAKLDYLQSDDYANEKLELIDKLEKLTQERESVARERQELQEQMRLLLHKSTEELNESRRIEESTQKSSQEAEEQKRISILEEEIEACKKLIAEQTSAIEEMTMKLQNKEAELEEKSQRILEQERSSLAIDALQQELKESLVTMEEWKFKCEEMEEKMKMLNTEKTTIEDRLVKLEEENRLLIEETKSKDITAKEQKEEMSLIIASLESRLQESFDLAVSKEKLISELEESVVDLNKKLNYEVNINENLKQDLLAINQVLKDTEAEVLRLKHESEMRMEEEERQKEELVNIQTLHDLENRLIMKEESISHITKEKESLLHMLENSEEARNQLQKSLDSMKLDNQNMQTLSNDLTKELNDAYRMLEQLKQKHLEDIHMQNRRLEDTLEELMSKTLENDSLRNELEDKAKILEQSIMIEEKLSLEGKINDLEQSLAEAKQKSLDQLEKMKKIAANLKKKSTICQELEARVLELQEKWTLEKDEKESKNIKIQEVEISIKEKDNKIADLEEKLNQSKNEAIESAAFTESLFLETKNSKEKLSVLMEQIAEMGEEIETLRQQLNQVSEDLSVERLTKEKILEEYESYKERVKQEDEQKQIMLDEFKENARELSVRMEVMEGQYMVQLATINNLQAENGLLASRNSQIIERLEDVEKESEDRLLQVENLRKEIVESTCVTTQTTEDFKNDEGTSLVDNVEETLIQSLESKLQERETEIEKLRREFTESVCVTTQTLEEDSRNNDKVHGKIYTHCNQCQTVVGALESKLQEQEMEIENLYNELANSIGNFFQIIQSNPRNDGPFNDLLLHYNALVSTNEKLKEKLMEVRNKLQEKTSVIEQSITMEKDEVRDLQDSTVFDVESSKNYETLQKELKDAQIDLESTRDKLQNSEKELELVQRELESTRQVLKNSQQELEDVLARATLSQQELISQQQSVDVERREAAEKYEILKKQNQQLEESVFVLEEENNQKLEKIDELLLEMQQYKEKREEKIDSPLVQKALISESNSPRLFNASEIFGTSGSLDTSDNKEVIRLQDLLKDKEDQLISLSNEIGNLQRLLSEEQAVRAELTERFKDFEQGTTLEIERLQQLLSEKDNHIGAINAQLNNVSDQFSNELESIERLNSLISVRNREIDALNKNLSNAREDFNNLEEKYVNESESYKSQLLSLQTDAKSLHDHLVEVTKEKELLQLQVNDLSRTLNEAKESFESQQNAIVQERDQAKELAASLMRSLKESQELREKEQPNIVSSVTNKPVESAIDDPIESSKSVDEKIEETDLLNVASGWDSGSNEKLNVDEEGWGWNAEEAQLVGDVQSIPLVPSLEVRLNARIDELQDQIKDLEAEKVKFLADNETVQLRNAKLVKKLKEYKVQMESLQQQLKIQKSASDFGGLDFAIEEELKSQIKSLEKTLGEVRETQKQVVAEKNSLMKRLDSVTSANENFTEMKKKTDMEIHVLQLQNKELIDKVGALESRLRDSEVNVPIVEGPVEISKVSQVESSTTVDRSPRNVQETSSEDLVEACKRYKEEIDDLKDEMEALATENEQLQRYLEDQKDRLTALESIKLQQEQNLSEAQKTKSELLEKTSKYNEEVLNLQYQIDEFLKKVNGLEQKLQDEACEKSLLLEKLKNLEVSEEKMSNLASSLAEVTELLNARVQEVAELKQELQAQYVIKEESEMKSNKTIRSLENDLSERQQELGKLRHVLGEMERELMEHKSAEAIGVIVSEATQELVQRHAMELEDKNVQIRAISDQLAAVQHTAEQYSSTLQNESIVLDSLQEEVARLKQILEQKDILVNEQVSQIQMHLSEIARLQELLGQSETTIRNLNEQIASLQELEKEVVSLRNVISQKDNYLLQYGEELNQYKAELEKNRQDYNNARNELQKQIEELQRSLKESESLKTNEKDGKLQTLNKVVDGLPVFTMSGSGDYDQDLQASVDQLKTEMAEKQDEVNHLRYLLTENTYPRMLQEMQDNINCLHAERREMEEVVETVKQRLNEKHTELENLRQQLADSIDKSNTTPRERSTLLDQEEIVKLQNELHEREQEINELKYIIGEKDSQLALQASMEPQSDDFELRKTIENLSNELYTKEQETQHLKSIIAEMQNEIARAREYERTIMESRAVIESLTSEKERIRVDMEQYLEMRLQEKEKEIEELKQRLYSENQQLMESLQLKSNDVENLKIQINEMSLEWSDRLRLKEDEANRASMDLTEKERRLAELSITKDAELHNLKVQIHDKDVKIEELLALTEEEERQLTELRQVVVAKETEIRSLNEQLEEKVKEYEMIQNALKKDISIIEAQAAQNSEKILSTDSGEMSSTELDLALYMLHQRDVRCEELTHELMQLLEERDTLQLRLSNAIRINEELRKPSANSPEKEAAPVASSSKDPTVEQPSPSKSEGPVEIAREAIDTSIGEDKEALAEKLSQLHTVGHVRDVRLRDERELRHMQQMSLLAHKDVLSTLPPEAAAKIVNANYTLSRDVQSQSSVLMNWLWGKSTPKVVHM
ncbi:protein lava lamp-like isoform X2 [Prorops nasuta]|uniref:protein lava lamp-like isoform X2 n=1 Tax=Prorops nasuta TaxID=863751 RepID=UPI0034CFC463